MDVFVTTRTPIIEDATDVADNVAGLVFQKDAIVLVEQMGVRSQSQYKLEYLGDLFVTDMLYGTKVLREDSVVPFVVPSS